MIIGILTGAFIAAETRITRPGGQVITADNLAEGFRVVDALPDTPEPEDVVRPWRPNIWLDPDDQVNHEGVTHKVRQRHYTQSDWLPSVVLALYKVVNTEPPVDGVLPWVANEQVWAASDPNHPTEPGANAATVRSFEGIDYTCLQGHTTQVGWHPPAVPALWAVA